MSTRALTTDADADAVPSVDAPEPDTDRGVSSAVGVPAIAFAATVLTMIGVGVLSGDPVTWHDAPRAVSNGATAAGAAGGLRWLFGRGGSE
ncbi:hypothetical protein JCM18237_00590 [Halorubrum luteum]